MKYLKLTLYSYHLGSKTVAMALKNGEVIVGYYRNYSFPDLLRQSEDNKGKWRNYKFVDLEKMPSTEIDYLVVLNKQPDDKKIVKRIVRGGNIVLIQEPPYEVNSYFLPVLDKFNLSISAFKKTTSNKNIDLPAGLPWHIDKSYQELTNLDVDKDTKKDEISWITSANNFYEGHKIRMSFMEYMKAQNFQFNLFGRGFKEIGDKYDGISPYKYSIAAENYIAENYFTEKIIDVFLSGSMPIYYGCKNIDKYFPKESYLQVDLLDPEKSLAKIKEAIDGNLFNQNFDYILEAKDLVLNKYQLFPLVKDLIENRLPEVNADKTEKFTLRPDGLTALQIAKKKVRQKLFSQKASKQ